MLIKILIVVVILILLRRHMGMLKPFWPLCVGLAIGGFTGWWLATLAVNTGVDFSTLEYFGCPRWFINFTGNSREMASPDYSRELTDMPTAGSAGILCLWAMWSGLISSSLIGLPQKASSTWARAKAAASTTSHTQLSN